MNYANLSQADIIKFNNYLIPVNIDINKTSHNHNLSLDFFNQQVLKDN